ncbi:MAG: hypothetical protein EXX96DRAFT_614692 [Benjaminiella poitrasii]|nr:MAG: hypothetical protein EXX96DRAFT_614692 [Benjaminiella poitrasii]
MGQRLCHDRELFLGWGFGLLVIIEVNLNQDGYIDILAKRFYPLFTHLIRQEEEEFIFQEDGFDGYIMQMQRVDGIYLVDLKSTIHIPTHVTQIKNFKDSLISLFKWKDRLVELQDIISSAKAVSSSSSNFDGIIKAYKRSPSPDDYTSFSPKKSH